MSSFASPSSAYPSPVSSLNERTWLVTCGCLIELIDGVRHFANHSRSWSSGFDVVHELLLSQCSIILLSPPISPLLSSNQSARNLLSQLKEHITVTPSGSEISSANDMWLTIQERLMNPPFNTNPSRVAVLHLATACSFRSPSISKEKLKQKEAGKSSRQIIDVEPNCQILGNIESKFPGLSVLGYETGSLKFSVRLGMNSSTEQFPLASSIQKLVGDLSVPSASSLSYSFSSSIFPPAQMIPPPQSLNNLFSICTSTASTPPSSSSSTSSSPTSSWSSLLSGRKVLMTTGPTVEVLTNDRCDVISNFSTGKQGLDIALALAMMGASVDLVLGPTFLPLWEHPGLKYFQVTSARSMRDRIMERINSRTPQNAYDAFFAVAAVADFYMANPPGKVEFSKSNPSTFTSASVSASSSSSSSSSSPTPLYRFELDQNPDILETVGKLNFSQGRPHWVVGFAAETAATEKMLEYGKGKLNRKGADAICANRVGADVGSNQALAKVPDSLSPTSPPPGTGKVSRSTPTVNTNAIYFISRSITSTPSSTNTTNSIGGEQTNMDVIVDSWGTMDKFQIGIKLGQRMAEFLKICNF